MRQDAARPRPLRGLGHPRRRGRLDVRGPGLVRPDRHLAARRRDQDPGRRRRRADVHRGRAAARAGAAGARTRGDGPAASQEVLKAARSTRPQDTDRPVEARLAALQAPELDAVLRRPPAARAGDGRRAPSRRTPTGSGRSSAAGTSSSRAPRARPWTPTTGKVTSRHVPDRRRAARRRRRDGLRRDLPAADPPDRRGQPQGPEQHPDPRPGRPRLAVGDRLARTAATTPSTPTSARSRTSTPSSRGPTSSGSRSPSTSRCSARPTTRGSPSTPSGSPPAPTAPSPTPRTRRRSTRTSTRSTSTTTPRASTPRCCGSSGTGWTTACGSSASTTRTPSRWRSGSGCWRRSARPTPTCSSCPRRSPGRR